MFLIFFQTGSGPDLAGMRRRLSSQKLGGSRSSSNTDLSMTRSRQLSGKRSIAPILGEDKLIQVEKSETASVKWSVYLDYFRAAGWHMSGGTFILYFIYQGK